jgi:excisionase family DNA binding protein
MTHDDSIRSGAPRPLTVTVRQACELTGLGPTTIWKLLYERKLYAVRPAGYRRTPSCAGARKRMLWP